MPSISETVNESLIAGTRPGESVPPSGKLSGTEELFGEAFMQKLKSLAKDNAEKYKVAKPFSHIYFDDFLPPAAAEAALGDFPEPKQLDWAEFNKPMERKLAFDAVEKLPRGVREVLFFLNSRPMVEFLEVLTGIEGVVSDP
jgi:hypothetical protein